MTMAVLNISRCNHVGSHSWNLHVLGSMKMTGSHFPGLFGTWNDGSAFLCSRYIANKWLTETAIGARLTADNSNRKTITSKQYTKVAITIDEASALGSFVSDRGVCWNHVRTEKNTKLGENSEKIIVSSLCSHRMHNWSSSNRDSDWNISDRDSDRSNRDSNQSGRRSCCRGRGEEERGDGGLLGFFLCVLVVFN